MSKFIQSGVNSFSIYLRPKIFLCGFLAFSSGFSVLFVVSTIPIWMNDFGITKTDIGWFISIAYLPYVLKILWAPLIDISTVPIIGRWLGHLRGWAVTMQFGIIACMFMLSSINPATSIISARIMVFLITFFSATRDIVTDAYRVEILDPEEIAPGSAMYLLGYRVGMLTAGAGGLLLADYLPWNLVFYVLTGFLFIGLITFLFIPDPNIHREYQQLELKLNLSWVYEVIGRLKRATIDPLWEFMGRKRWLLILLIIPFYKLGDNFVQSMSNLFFINIGFSKTDIAVAVKCFGLIASILGSIWGGIIVNKMGDLRTMFVNGIIHMLAFGAFVLQDQIGDNLFMLYFTIALTHVTGGIVTTAFVSFISNLCHSSYKATQYAMFSSLRSLDKCLVFGSGWLADHLLWKTYFIITPLFGLPALILIGYVLWTKHPMRALFAQPSRASAS